MICLKEDALRPSYGPPAAKNKADMNHYYIGDV